MISDLHKILEVEIEGQTVPIWAYGDQSKPLIIFIHGYFRGFSQYSGDLPMRHLMKDYCVLAFDLPGFGTSKKIRMDRVGFIHEIVTKLYDDKRFVLFGISYGGVLAIKYALKYPGNVKGLIIGGMPYFHGLKQVLKLSYIIPLIKNFDISRVIKEFRLLNKANLDKLNIPALLLYSSSDTQASSKMGETLNTLIPDSKIFIITGVNHSWLMHEINKTGFLTQINNFLKQLEF